MATVERTEVIAAQPPDVWAALADYAAIVAWAPNVDHSCLLTEQETGVGAARRIQSGRTTLVETVVIWTPNEELSYEITGLPSVIRSVISTWRLAAEGDGTRVSLTSEVDAGARPPQKLIAKVAGRKLGLAADEMLGGLAAHLSKQTSTS